MTQPTVSAVSSATNEVSSELSAVPLNRTVTSENDPRGARVLRVVAPIA